jgi:predicted alpha/beta-hydrolase family hydrolase
MLSAMPQVQIPVGGFSVSASIHGEGRTVVMLGHGAGGDRRNRLLLRVADALAGSGRRALLYNFRYTEQRRRAPDPPAVLERTAAAVGEFAVEHLDAAHLVHGGKSMGGRIASQAVAQGARAEALVFLGYPLHAPGRTEKLRDAHLGDIQAPMLFLQGTRDAFARWHLIEGVTRRLGKRASLHRVEAADHSFGVTKRSGRSPAEVEAEILGTLVDWLSGQGL